MDADSLVCAYGMLGLNVWNIERTLKGNLKLPLKYILSQFNSEDIEGSDEKGSYLYVKLHNHLRVSFSETFKNLNSWKKACLIGTSSLEFYLEKLDSFVGGSC